MASSEPPVLCTSPSSIDDVKKWVDHIPRTLQAQLACDATLPISIFKLPESRVSEKPDAYIPQQTGLGPIYHFRKTRRLHSSITDYCTRIERLADDLEDIDSPVLENDLVIYTVNDLTNRFDYIASVIRHKSPLPSFSETRSMLLLEESIFLLLNHIIMLPDIFFKARIPTNDIQVLGVDYQLLSNPVKGEAYHKIGKSGAPDDTLVDHAAVFGMLFGGDSFEDYIGQLYMASLLEEVGQAPEILQMKVPKGMREFQKERETKLINNSQESASAVC